MARSIVHLAVLAALAAGAPARADPLVLELFTSQGCSSCPPADTLLSELAAQPDTLPLAMHVDYWNGIGWHDPFSLPALTARQNRYGALLNQDSIYTPELVIGGSQGVVGSDRAAVTAAIDTARAAAAARPAIQLAVQTSGASLMIKAASGQGRGTVWLVGYDRHHTTQIRGGENGGRTLNETNVVRSLAPVAAWSGAALQLTVARPAGETSAVFLQATDGSIVAAAVL